MKRLLSAAMAAGLIALAATAVRADAPIKNSWTGMYVAGGLGYAAWTADTITTNPVTGVCVLCVPQTQGGSGMFGVLALGYDARLSNNIVAGVFIDGSLGSVKGTIQDQGPFFVGEIKDDRAFSVGARAGLLVNPSVLTYGTIGYSWAHFTGANMVTAFAGVPTAFFTNAFWREGWFVGSGIEVALQPGWNWRTEYRYTDYGKESIVDTNGILFNNNIQFEPREQSVRSELVYRFNSGM